MRVERSRKDLRRLYEVSHVTKSKFIQREGNARRVLMGPQRCIILQRKQKSELNLNLKIMNLILNILFSSTIFICRLMVLNCVFADLILANEVRARDFW